MTRQPISRSFFAFTALGALAVSGASAAVIDQGTYKLHNHPDGSARPPLYGMRLDELFDVTVGAKDIFTFDFDDARSDMKMTYDGSSIHIFGVSWGGRDIGNGYAADIHRGLYTIDFSFDLGIRSALNDDDLVADSSNRANNGFILPPVGPSISLVDERSMNPSEPYSFRLGDEDSDLGHRGFPGISGWGWLTHHVEIQGHIADSDFLFTAELIPAPGTLGVIGAFGLLGGRRRRR